MLVSAIAGSRSVDRMTIASKPSGPLGVLRRIISQLLPKDPSAAALRRLYTDAAAALEDRNHITHSLHGLVMRYSSGTANALVGGAG